MAQNRMYWILLEAKHGHVDLRVNDVPAQRLGDLGARNTPVNEYLVKGRNVAAAFVGSDADPAKPPNGEGLSKVSVRIEEIVFDEADEELSRRPLAEREVDVRLVPSDPRPLLTLEFEAQPRRGLPDLNAFTPIGPAERAAIVEQLRAVAVWWSEGRAEAIVDWLQPYIDDFVAAYPTETVEDYRKSFIEMVRAYSPPKAKLDFNPAQLDLDICGGGRLAECRSKGREGAAIRMVREPTNYYDFNLIVGVRAGKVVAVR